MNASVINVFATQTQMVNFVNQAFSYVYYDEFNVQHNLYGTSSVSGAVGCDEYGDVSFWTEVR